VSDRLTFVLPEPPTFNAMLALAKKRTRKYKGAWLDKAQPVVYDEAKSDYETKCTLCANAARKFPPREPWRAWALESVELRVHQLYDPIELLGALKWPVDWLVKRGYVANDSAEELLDYPKPVQRIERRNRGITLTIRRAEPVDTVTERVA
jgi:hypothetical protein